MSSLVVSQMQAACQMLKGDDLAMSYNRRWLVLSHFSQKNTCECFSWSRSRWQTHFFLTQLCLSGLLWGLISRPSFALRPSLWSGLVFLSAWRGLAALSLPTWPIHPFWPPVTPPFPPDGMLDWSFQCWLWKFCEVGNIVWLLLQTFSSHCDSRFCKNDATHLNSRFRFI